MKGKLFLQLLLGMCFFSLPAFASVPHDVDKYDFHIDLPDGFTRFVEEDNTEQWLYNSYHGNHEDKSLIHIMLQRQDSADWDADWLKVQLYQTVKVYKERGAEVLKAEIVKVGNRDALMINSRHNGKEHLSLQMYNKQIMCIVSCGYTKADKHGKKDFLPMLKSVNL